MTAIASQVSGEYEARFLELHEPDVEGGLNWGWESRAKTEARRRLIPDCYTGPEWEAYCCAGLNLDRHEWVRRWAWAVPTVEAIEAIVEIGPLVEIGAGTGYWAMLLREHGADVQAFEPRPIYGNGYKHRRAYAAIARGDHHRALRMYPDRTPMLCWAPYDDPMAAEVILGTRAERLVWIGELHGCNGDDAAMALLGDPPWRDDDEPPPPDQLFAHERTIDIPQWPGLHDAVHIYRRT